MINSMEDKIDELADWEVERLAQVFKTRADVLTGIEYDAVLRIFLYDGITPFSKMSNDLIELEYKEMTETKNDFTD